MGAEYGGFADQETYLRSLLRGFWETLRAQASLSLVVIVHCIIESTFRKCEGLGETDMAPDGLSLGFLVREEGREVRNTQEGNLEGTIEEGQRAVSGCGGCDHRL